MAIQTLFDTLALRPLGAVAHKLGVEILLYGSSASRALLRDRLNLPINSLFELAEHVSDIDIAHTGGAAMTPRVREAILEEVPLASWLRWSIIDWRTYQSNQTLDTWNWRVPLRTVRIASDAALSITEPTEKAVENMTVEFIPRGDFSRSPRAYYDSELAAAFLYFDTLFDVLELTSTAGSETGVDVDTTAAYLAVSQGLNRLRLLQGDFRAKALRRLWYKAGAFALRSSANTMRDFVDLFRLAPAFEALSELYGDDRLQQLSNPGAAIAISSAISGGTFRTFLYNEGSIPIDELKEKYMFPPQLDLADGNEIVTALVNMPVVHGEAPSAQPAPLAQEFVHLSIPAPTRIPQEDLSAIIVGEHAGEAAILPGFTIVSASASGSLRGSLDDDRIYWDRDLTTLPRWTVRANLGGMLKSIERMHMFVTARTAGRD